MGGGSKTECPNNLGEKEKKLMHLFCSLHCRQILGIHSSTRSLHNTQANIRNTFFDRRSPQHFELGFSQWHRHADTWSSIFSEVIGPEGQFTMQRHFFFRWVTTVLTMMDTDEAGSRVRRGHNSRSIDRHLLQNSDG